MNIHSIDAAVVLAPYLEPLVRGRRVVILGDSSSVLGASLLDRGARLVHVYDPDAVRAAESAARGTSLRGLVVARLPDTDLGVRDGAFDVVVVPDLTEFSSPGGIAQQAARLAAPTGAALFASPNPEVVTAAPQRSKNRLTYYELYDAVSLQFPEVRMLGQAPFAGYVIADFSPDDEPDVTVDTSLMERGAEEPHWFIALASRRRTRLDPYALFQVPISGEATTPVSGPSAADLTTELEKAQNQIQTLQAAVESERKALEESRAGQIKLAQLEATLHATEKQLHDAETRAGDAHVRAGRLDGKIRDLDEELRRQRDRGTRLNKELDDEKKLRTKAELELGMVKRGSELPPPKIRDEQIASLQNQVEKLEGERNAFREHSEKVEALLAQTQGQVRELRQASEHFSDELRDSQALAKQSDSRVRELQQLVAEREARIRELDAAIVGMADEASKCSMANEQLKHLRRERDEAVQQMTQMRSENEEEIGRLEKKLVERARELETMRVEVDRREQLVRELVLVYEEARARGAEVTAPEHLIDTISALRTQLDRLAAVAARREAELQAVSWRVQELENEAKLNHVDSQPSAQQAELEKALHAAHAELDSLRKRCQIEQGERRDRALDSVDGSLRDSGQSTCEEGPIAKA